MSARCLPEAPKFASPAEAEVWERLRETLPADVLLLANVVLVDEELDHEADLIVMFPDVGIVVVEVKGGSVHYDGEQWWQSGGGHQHKIDPVAQVRRVKYAVRDYVEGAPGWSRGHVAWAHAVVTPYSGFPQDFELADCPRWSLHDKDDLPDLAAGLEATARRMQQGRRPPTHDDVEVASQQLRGRSFTVPDRNAEAAERASEVERLTAEQAALLSVTRLLHRVEVRGGAGSGKTMLALAQARELSRGRSDMAPQRVALLCYSIGLAEFLKRQVEAWPAWQRPFVGTFHEFGKQWGAPDGDREDGHFWETELPATMAELAVGLEDEQRYDSIIVDEAQDFADDWWTSLLRSLRDPERGGLFIYSDENQRIFARFGQPPVPLIPLVLDHNLRNTKQIHQAFAPLAPTKMTARGGEGVDVTFIPSTDPLDHADDAVELLLDVGWSPGNIALLTTGKRHPEQKSLTELLGQIGYWRTYYDDDVFYGHVLGCKGLERPAVVLCVNETEPKERAREKLYVGMSRATDQLIIVGDPAVVRAVGGPDVAAKLGI